MTTTNESSPTPVSTRSPFIVRLVIAIGAVLFALLIVTILGFALTHRLVIGSGNVKSEARPVSGFTQVSLDGMGDMTIQQTGTESLTIEAEDNILPLITSQVSGNRLTIGLNEGVPFSIVIPRKPIHYLLTVKDLNELAISGSASVSMDSLTATSLTVAISGSGDFTISHLNTPTLHASIAGSGNANIADLTATTLTASIAGSGNMTLSGQTHDQAITIDGSGSYQASGLTSSVARISVAGSGTASVVAQDTLVVQIAGSGSVTYCGGNPNITEHISGSGSIQHC